jgi:hypothetical protein
MIKNQWAPTLFAPTNPLPIHWHRDWVARPEITFPPLCLLSVENRGTHKTEYFSHILTDDVNMYVVPVLLHKTQRVGTMPQVWPLKQKGMRIGSTIKLADTSLVCSENMKKPIFIDKDRIFFQRKNAIISQLKDDIRIVTDPTYRSEKIRRVAEEYDCTPQWVRQLLSTYWRFLGHPFALMQHHYRKGASGVSRMGTTSNKLGRPNSAVVSGRGASYAGANMTPNYMGVAHELLSKMKTGKFTSIADFQREVHANCFAYNLGENGEKRKFQVSYKKLPSKETAQAWLSLFARNSPEFKRVLPPAAYRKYIAARKGSVRDIVHPGEIVLDFDGVQFDMQLSRDGTSDSISNVLIMFGTCRTSQCIVAFHFSLGNENTDAYKRCVLSALTSKSEILQRYERPELIDGFVHGTFDTMFVDRGPGKSRESIKFINIQSTDLTFAPPMTPQAKAVVENTNKIIQAAMAGLPGSYKLESSQDNRVVWRVARKGGVIGWTEFIRLVLAAIRDHNLAMDMSKYLSPEMLDAKVTPNPLGIYDWNRRHRIEPFITKEQQRRLMWQLLEERKLVATEGNVSMYGLVFSSDELRSFVERQPSTPSGYRKAPTITVGINADNIGREIYWFRDASDISVLERVDGAIPVGESIGLKEAKQLASRRASARVVLRHDTTLALPKERQDIKSSIATTGREKANSKKVSENRKSQHEANNAQEKVYFEETMDIRRPVGPTKLPSDGELSTQSDAQSDLDKEQFRDNPW